MGVRAALHGPNFPSSKEPQQWETRRTFVDLVVHVRLVGVVVHARVARPKNRFNTSWLKPYLLI